MELVNEILKQLSLIEITINEEKKEIYTKPEQIKKEVEEILEKNNDLLKWNLIKIELLQTQAQAIAILWNLEESLKIFDKIEDLIKNEINFSDAEKENQNQKEKLIIENIITKLKHLSNHSWIVLDENWNINPKLYNFIENIFTKEINKLREKWIEDKWIYEQWIFYFTIWETKKANIYFKKAAYKWNSQAIDIYTTNLINDFLVKYNSKKNKEKFLKNNLESFEIEFFKFIDNTSYDRDNKRIKTIYWWNKYLYEKIWDFYSEIWLFPEALDAYKSWINSWFNWSYKLYEKIAQLYEKYESKIIVFNKNKIKEYIEKNYKNLYQFASLAWDLEYKVKWLEKLWDISKKNKKTDYWKYYINAILSLIDYYSYNSLKTIARLMEKLEINFLNLKQWNHTYKLDLEDIYTQLIDFFDNSFLLSLWNYYENNNEILWAFYCYVNAYQRKIEDSKNALIIFIETTLKNKVSNDYNKAFNRKKSEEIIKIEEELFFIKNSILKTIIKNIENENIQEEDIATLFDISLWEDFYDTLNFEKILFFINNYQNKHINFNIYLHRILETYFWMNWTNIKNIEIKKLLKKIYNFQEINNSDIELIKKLIEE